MLEWIHHSMLTWYVVSVDVNPLRLELNQCSWTYTATEAVTFATHKRFARKLAPSWEGLPGPQRSATESKPPRAAPQAGRPTHKVRQQHPRLDLMQVVRARPVSHSAVMQCYSHRYVVTGPRSLPPGVT